MVVAAPPAESLDLAQIAELQTTIERMEHTLAALSEAIAWTDGDGNISWCNPAFSRLAMRPAVALIGKPVEQALKLTLFGEQLKPGQHPVRKALSDDRAATSLIDSYEAERGGQSRFLEVYASSQRSQAQPSALMVVRDITERQLAERWLEAEGQRSELVRAVAAASNLAEDPETALDAGLELICRFLGWPLAHAILIGPGAHLHLWRRPGPGDGFGNFIDAAGLPGKRLCGATAQVAESGKARWIPDVTAAGESCSAEAMACQLRASLVLPVKSFQECKAVLEFFHTEAQPPDPELMPLFEQIGEQLGRVFERQQSRLSLVNAKEDLEKRVEERTRELTGLNGTLRSEIENRERFQDALREAMERYHSLMQSVRDVIFAVSPAGRVESFNSAFDALTGSLSQELIGRRVMGLIHPEDRRTAAEAFRLTLSGHPVPPFEFRLRHAAGSWVFVECSLTLQMKAGEVSSVTGIARDVTASRRAKAELIIRDRAMASTSEGILITDSTQPGNPITFVNQGFETLSGFSGAEVLGKGLELLSGPETAKDSLDRLRLAFEDCQPLTVEMKAYRRDGQSVWVRIVITPVRDEQNRPANFVAIVSDISHQKEAERMKNEFVSTVSHELRTPLTSLRGFAELMLEREYPPEKQKKFIQIILRESTRLSKLINDFLDVQRMEAGRQDYHFSKVRLPQILEDSAALFRPTSPIHTFEVVYPQELPEVRADVDRLRQITTNLLSNAVKFSPQGGAVKLEARLDGAMVVFSVADQGIGIAPEAAGRLFEKFYRVDNTATRKIGGTGLGLSIVKQIVDAHGGRVWVESQPGEGTRFLFTLPVFA